MKCPKCGGQLFPDDGTRGTREDVCFNCGYRLYDGYPAHPPTLEDRRQVAFDQLPYCQQVAYLKARKKRG